MGAASGQRRSSSSSVAQYKLDKVLDPKQLDKIIYQPGIGYSTAGSTRLSSASAGGTYEFNIGGFSQFLHVSQCLGVLLFWKEAEEYLNMFSQKERAACAQKIFQRYLKKGAEYEVNLTGVNDQTVAGIEKTLGNPPEDVFESAQLAAYKMMSLDLFPRFWEAVKAQQSNETQTAALTAESSLKDVLNDEKEVVLFSEYCKIHFCEEQVLFWLETNDHRLLFDPTDLQQQGQRLYDVYIDDAKSEARINVSDRVAKAIQGKLESGKVDRTLFDQAIVEVESMLELDVWPRYKDAVISGEYDPRTGQSDVQQHNQVDDLEVDMTKPSKAAVRVTLKKASELEKLRKAAAERGCGEMVDYCKECAEYEKLFSEADRFQKAQIIFKRHLAQGCDMPVNIPDTQLKEIQKSIDKPTAAIFKKSFEECVKLISDNVYQLYLDEAAKAKAEAESKAATEAPVKAGGGGCFPRCVIS